MADCGLLRLIPPSLCACQRATHLPVLGSGLELLLLLGLFVVDGGRMDRII